MFASQVTTLVAMFLPLGLQEPVENALGPADSRSVENEWYLPTEDGKARLYVWEVGRGTPVIVVHGGFGAEHSYLYDALRGLTEGYRLVFYDQRGSLRSPCARENITFANHVGDLDQLRRELGLERVSIFGHSMGTILCLQFLSDHPENVENLVLAGAPRADTRFEPRLAGELQAFFGREEIQVEIERIRASGLQGAKLDTALWRIQFAGANTFHVERWRTMKGGQSFYNQEAGTAAGKTLPGQWDFTPAIEEHDRPITIINGDHDFVDFGGEYYLELSDRIANLDYVLLENAGHNCWLDDPEGFRGALVAALPDRK